MTEPSNEQRRRLGIQQRDYEADRAIKQRLLFWGVAVALLVGLGAFVVWAFT